MKYSFSGKAKKLFIVALTLAPVLGFGQSKFQEFYGRPSYWRPHDQTGINVFETTKVPDSIPFEGPRVRFGAGFTQQFQKLKHETGSGIALYEMGAGFNLAQANLFMDIQLADGIRLDVTSYLSARHHNEYWVKGGYIQFDKLPFKGRFFDKIMEIATIKIGHFEINYGDQHFRRTDGGNAIYNPFIENYIVDAFSTEIGGEIYLQKNGLFGMVGMTNGTINSSIGKQAADFNKDSAKNPAIFFKGGIDKTMASGLRVRVTGSAYINNKSQRNVLYAGDRTGSNYWGVMEPKGASLTANFSSGRFAPGFTRDVKSIMLNTLLKYQGAEVFATYETSKGNAGSAVDPTDRKMKQIAIEGVYRFGAKENVFIGARYNKVNCELPGYTEEIDIKRTAFSAGWFLTRNILLKGEIVNQKYNNFKVTDIRNQGKFNGYAIEAVIGF
ncbi:MAG: hypothetical protein ACXWV5_09830 [Flavitalea sp.]